MKTSRLLIAASFAALAVTSASAEVVIYDSNTDGLDVVAEGGLTATLTAEPPDSDGNPTLAIGGDPTSVYSKFYSPGFKPTKETSGTILRPLPADPNQEYTLTFEVYLPTEAQIDGTTVITQFYRDPERDYKVNDFSSQEGDGVQVEQQHDYKSIRLDPTSRDMWQSVSIVGSVPAEDKGQHPIGAMRFSITFKQIDTETNDAPIEAYVRNIRLTTDAEPGPPAE